MAAQVDGRGILLDRAVDGPVDLRVAGHRVWSFTAVRDGIRSGRGIFVPLPPALAGALDGNAEVEVVPHLGGAPLFAGIVRFGSSSTPLQLVDASGARLSLDRAGRLRPGVDGYDDEARRVLVEAAHRAVADLADQCGLRVYLCYGALLGAARSGRMVDHDAGIELAFLARRDHPFDVIRECRAAERAMAGLGWHVVRRSAASFRIWVRLPDGRRAGIDVLGSFHLGDQFHLAGSLRAPLPRTAVFPFGEIALEGHCFPAPADVRGFLDLTYGHTWRTPDPAFRFDHPAQNVRRTAHWFRGTRSRLQHWQRFYRGRHLSVPTEPSLFARWAADWMDPGDGVVELGSGTGRDAIWFTQQGHPTVGSDYCGVARSVAREASAQAGVAVDFRDVNVESLRSVLVGAARIAHEPGRRHVYARGLIDALAPTGRSGLWRFCAIAGRHGGLTFLEFRTRRSRRKRTFFDPHPRTYARPEEIVAEIERYGGRVLDQQVGRGLAPLGSEDPVICRLVVSWRKS